MGNISAKRSVSFKCQKSKILQCVHTCKYNWPVSLAKKSFFLIFITSRQLLRLAQPPPVQSVFRVEHLSQEANHLHLSSAWVKNVWRYICCTVYELCCSQHRLNNRDG
jgi:hypothetical protein